MLSISDEELRKLTTLRTKLSDLLTRAGAVSQPQMMMRQECGGCKGCEGCQGCSKTLS